MSLRRRDLTSGRVDSSSSQWAGPFWLQPTVSSVLDKWLMSPSSSSFQGKSRHRNTICEVAVGGSEVVWDGSKSLMREHWWTSLELWDALGYVHGEKEGSRGIVRNNSQALECPGEGNGNPLQYSCLENPMDWGAWQAVAHKVTRSWTSLKGLSTHAQRKRKTAR